jgi:hypothetical protein
VVSLAVAPQTADQIAQQGLRFYVKSDWPGTFPIQCLTKLTSWQPIATLQYTNGLVEVLESTANQSAARFYRASQP